MGHSYDFRLFVFLRGHKAIYSLISSTSFLILVKSIQLASQRSFFLYLSIIYLYDGIYKSHFDRCFRIRNFVLQFCSYLLNTLHKITVSAIIMLTQALKFQLLRMSILLYSISYKFFYIPYVRAAQSILLLNFYFFISRISLGF